MITTVDCLVGRAPAADDDLEQRLRSAGEVGDDSTLRAYTAYYKTRGQTYHVQAQRDSVARRHKPIPTRAALVEATLRADSSRDGDRYTTLSGKTAALRSGDMLMRDAAGIVSSVLRGPDQRTPIEADTRNVLFAVYAPPGIDDVTVSRHLLDIEANVRLVAPEAHPRAHHHRGRPLISRAHMIFATGAYLRGNRHAAARPAA